MNKNIIYKQKGFTLLEIIVATGIFSVVMLIAVGAVLNAVDANRKAQNINVVVNNLNLAIESMVRDLRTGHNYSSSCGSACVQFDDKDGNQNVQYKLTGGGIAKSGPATILGAGTITSSEVVLSSVVFNVQGGSNRDGPERILVQIKGMVGTGKTASSFNIETLVTSRILDVSELI